MVKTCAVADCPSSSRKMDPALPGWQDPVIKGWASFPSKKKFRYRRKLWETRCKRGFKWKAERHHVICSKHFIDWCNGPSPAHPDPVLFEYNNWGKNVHVRKSKYKRPNVRRIRPEEQDKFVQPESVVYEHLDLASYTITSDDEFEESKPVIEDGNISSSSGGLFYVFPTKDMDQGMDVELNIDGESPEVTAGRNEVVTTPAAHCDHQYFSAGVDSSSADPVDASTQTDDDLTDTEMKNMFEAHLKNKMLGSDVKVRQYTGLPSRKLLVAIFEIIQKRVKVINYWKQGKFMRNKSGHFMRSARRGKLERFDEYILTLMFIKASLSLGTLADLFGVAKATASNTIITWINVLYHLLNSSLMWPSADEVKENMQSSRPSENASVRVILDSVEFPNTRPWCRSGESKVVSANKQKDTAKALVGVTPSGVITFVSTPYSSSTSDKSVVEKEFVEKVEPGDAVVSGVNLMNISDLLNDKQAKLHIAPAVKSKQGRKPQKPVIAPKTKSSVSLEIHADTVRRMMKFKILENPRNFNLWPVLREVLVVISVFCNMDHLNIGL